MQSLVPLFIQQRVESEKWSGSLKGFTLNIDLSGFTVLTQSLMNQGLSGAERLSMILNEVFEPLVGLMYDRGGFIPYFAGDAFTAIFPLEINRKHALHLLRTADEARALFKDREQQFDDQFSIAVKAGLAAGNVNYGIVGEELKAFYFRGEAINSAANCQMLADEQEILIDELMHTLLEGRGMVLEEVKHTAYRVVSDIPRLDPKEVQVQRQFTGEENEGMGEQFLPAAVLRYDLPGEFRTVVSTFISFDQVNTHEELDRFASIILQHVQDFGGYFKEVDYGDKGSLMVVFFGAPVSYENNSARAMEFALTIQEKLDVLREDGDANFRCRIGMTVGTAYTGFIGGEERRQYACVGNHVNLAARIMSNADWQEILVDGELAKTAQFRFRLKGNIQYKGIPDAVPTFTLNGRRQTLGKPNYGGDLIGRDREIEEMVKFASPLFSGDRAGIIYVVGEAGIGKSRLTHEVKRQLDERQTINWLLGSSDQILRKAFNPFVYLLRRMFRQSIDLGSTQNLRRFQFRLSQIKQSLRRTDHEQVEDVLQELDRTESVLTALLGITLPGSLWTQLDAQGRYQNTVAAIVNLLVAECMISPTVLELEDIHWIDEDSVMVVRELIRRTQSLPLLIIATARRYDDGEQPRLINEFARSQMGLKEISLEITALTTEAVRRMAETTLGDTIADDCLETLLSATNSNPFYLEQILAYFRENDLLVRNRSGELSISDESIKLSTSITSILTARIDRLSDMVRETVKAAAVIGREFEVPVLSEVMRQESGYDDTEEIMVLLREQIAAAERGQIWSAMNELRYIFRHSLLREAVYGMQLTTRLQQLHKQIAHAIEKLYGESIEERYVDLAFHYEQSGDKDKTIEYLGKAANFARANYQNQQALDLYERLIEKISQQSDQEVTVNTHINRGKVLEIVGRWEEAQEAYEQAQDLAKSSRDIILLGRANNHLGRLHTLKGDYEKAMDYLTVAAGLFESVDDIFGLAKSYSSMGNLYFRTAHYQKALTYYQKSLDDGFSQAGTSSAAETISHLGLTYMNLGRYAEAIRVVEEQIPRHEINHDSMGLASLYTNLGIIYFESGGYEKAMENHRRGLALAEELGNKRLQAIGLGSMGSVYERQSHYELALEYFERDLEICQELGDRQGLAVVEGLIGDINSVVGNFTKAIQHLDRSLRISRELGYRKGVAKAVNTLGDIYYLQGQHDVSLRNYNQAIEIARGTNNRLVLASSLEEKGRVLLADGQLEELRAVESEALALAEELGNPDLLFGARLLHARYLAAHNPAKIEDALHIIEELLSEEDITLEQRADALLGRYRISGGFDKEAKQEALDMYAKLYEKTPKFIYNYYLEMLREDRVVD
ncbi:tetratricopeptide repeat protein [Lewinella sp. W8]|uniref:tetratricopeptide repeat protein n=1 Tax=Lewinella sp. W8 TaxID=2528208 RepID=UPI00106770BB|nr:tetratricopeptide repeat protein [Lewinella sp. W8]MTB50595.1 tetratricopeptide repeat protein [Lewinella sp. W8]